MCAVAAPGARHDDRTERDVRSRRRLERASRRRDGDDDDDREVGQVSALEDAAYRVAHEVNALVQAWSEANTELVTGAVTVLGNLFLDANNSLVRPAGYRSGRRRTQSTDRGTGSTSRGESAGSADSDRSDVEARVQDAGDAAADMIRQGANVVNDGASVITRSARRFQERYNEVIGEGERSPRQDEHEAESASTGTTTTAAPSRSDTKS
jgi:hypothetical protein